MTKIKEEAVEIANAIETASISKNGEESKGEKNLRLNLAQVPCIRYSISFQKKFVLVLALLDSSSRVNAIHLTFAKELDLPIRPTDVEIQKIDGTMLNTFGIIVVAFSVMHKTHRVRFLEKTFLIANVSPEVVLEMLFFTLSGIDINFLGQEP